MRRLPIYLLLDCSGSMMGEPITAVQTGLQNLVATLRQDPYALETAYISVITFDSDARQTVPLTELSQFNPNTLCHWDNCNGCCPQVAVRAHRS